VQAEHLLGSFVPLSGGLGHFSACAGCWVGWGGDLGHRILADGVPGLTVAETMGLFTAGVGLGSVSRFVVGTQDWGSSLGRADLSPPLILHVIFHTHMQALWDKVA
jgi:hypothetical protein